jgi:hypothetical protein
MRLLKSCSLLLALAGLILTSTSARGQCRDCYDAYLLATYDGSAMQLRLSLGHRIFGPSTCRGNAVGFDVYRKTLGYECGAEVRVTDEPIAWPTVECSASADVSFTDPNVTLDTAYGYEARPVDAERNPAQGEQVSPVWGVGVAGTALLAHGLVHQGDNFNVIVDPCPGECTASGIVRMSGVDWAALWGNTVEVYGNNVGVEYYSNLWLTMMEGTSVRPALCVVSVERTGWGAVKVLYK